jgi:hypothetical protein
MNLEFRENFLSRIFNGVSNEIISVKIFRSGTPVGRGGFAQLLEAIQEALKELF